MLQKLLIFIFLIVHRLSTVKKCDKFFLLDNDELKGKGSFEELDQFTIKFKY